MSYIVKLADLPEKLDSLDLILDKIVEGDCLELMRRMPDKCVDAVITDPPYGIAHPTDFHSRGRDKLAPCRDYPRVIGDDAPFDPRPILSLSVPTVLWGANHYADRLPASSGWLVWDKERPDELDQATCELAWTNFIKGVRRFRHLWNGMMRASDDELVHPTQKPVALIEWILNLRWTPLGLIFDPFIGSGTTAVAAKKLGRHFIGCEISHEYCRIAEERLLRLDAQPGLFEPSELKLAEEFLLPLMEAEPNAAD